MIKSLNAVDKDWSLFLDRDGVINVRPENDYVKTPEEFIFIENVPQALVQLNKIFKYLFVVTNQQGIGKGLMSASALDFIHKTMLDELLKEGGEINEIFFCPNKKEDNSILRKPNVGMALAAKKKFKDVNFKKSVMVGDSVTDMKFGKRLKMITVFISPDIAEVRDNHKLIDFHFKSLYDFSVHMKSLYIEHNY